ncbi:flocculation protein FLO11-like isoform X2 [Leguminivora glycinivorella]|uniref:flocculation protein FLO11-like isoform X2 n=1 Tax=Leguminivora glycinivorella TaxID=1035111 RepID=UPI00200BA4C7|nr:flocculation protein FLO11-like isoform X2 [Leguminivora glycinivorella]
MESINQCHCCLQRPPAKDLRTPYTRHGITEIYSLMIEECFVIKLTSSNDDQSGICEECLRLLREASSFKMQVLRCQTELRGRLEAALRVKAEKVLDEPPEDDPCSGVPEASLHEEGPAPPCKEEPRDEYMSPPGEESPAPPCKEEPRDGYLSPGEYEVSSAPLPSRAVQQLTLGCYVKLKRLRDTPRASTPCPVTSHRESQPCPVTSHRESQPCPVTSYRESQPCPVTSHRESQPCPVTSYRESQPCPVTSHRESQPCPVTSHCESQPCPVTSHRASQPCPVTSHCESQPCPVTSHRASQLREYLKVVIWVLFYF